MPEEKRPVTAERIQGKKAAIWSRVQLARDPKRPTAKYYIDKLFDDFVELSGDRLFGEDKAILGGIAHFMGRPVTVIGQEKGVTIEEKTERNFGCAHPEGYRKTHRLMEQAEKFGRPIICLVDTQGAYCGVGAEERGMGAAIAENLQIMSMLRVPIVSILIGEGGSGGALALAVADKIAMLENSIYSILSPEGFASILWRDANRAREAAELMKLTADEVHSLGIIDKVLYEGGGGAHIAPELSASAVKGFIKESLDDLCTLSGDELVASRYERYRSLGQSYIAMPVCKEKITDEDL